MDHASAFNDQDGGAVITCGCGWTEVIDHGRAEATTGNLLELMRRHGRHVLAVRSGTPVASRIG